MRRWMFGLGALVATTALAMACSVGNDCDFGLCAGPAAGGDGGGGADGATDADAIAPPPGCKPDVDPKDAPLCVVSEYGVFVAPDGKPDAAGTREAPVDSIASALAIVGNKPRIYVCKGAYPEAISLAAPVSIYGGFACGSWTHTGEKPTFSPTASGEFALRATGITANVTFADLELSAKPGDATNPSSITAFISNSPKVTFRRVTLIAHEGFDGPPGKPGETGVSDQADLNGNAPKAASDGGEGGAAKVCTCSSGGTTKGGRGGNTLGVGNNGADGETAMANPSPVGFNGAGQTSITCQSAGLPPRNGSNAPAADDALAPVSFGSITASGWKATDGAAGQGGKPGQGGGGAGGNSGGASPGGGGGGACGGCGGTGGGGGTAGGSSIALMTFAAPVRIDSSVLTAKRAGRGGNGSNGGAGAVGGFGGFRGGSCSGGNGGSGGSGGYGAGGSGGVSAGVLHKNGAPALDALTETAITFGARGDKGAGGIPANDGKPGEAKKVLSLEVMPARARQR